MSWFCFKGGLQNYARIIVAALWDVKVLLSCLRAEPDGLEKGVDHGLERGPAIEWGHDVLPSGILMFSTVFGVFCIEKT